MGMAEADRIRLVVPKETARNSENINVHECAMAMIEGRAPDNMLPESSDVGQ